jgi:hypothetical protein
LNIEKYNPYLLDFQLEWAACAAWYDGHKMFIWLVACGIIMKIE